MLKAYYQKKFPEAGCDEAGRGCLAGPVFAAAVVFPQGYKNKLLNDSKQLNAAMREQLRKEVERDALAWAVASVSHEEIDSINILNASIKAMHLSLQKIPGTFGFILVDGNRFKPFDQVPYQTVVSGDATYQHIAAASILAKTYRDDWMMEAHRRFPQYGWDTNKGYGTAAHRAAIMAHGLCTLHRKSFQLKEFQTELFR
ncbi:MAG: ribonuclease HII [Chitinophagales bacterium]